jgi:hypothetical protein
MKHCKHKEINLYLFESYNEYEEWLSKQDMKTVFTDVDGNEVEIDPTTIDFSESQQREHFAPNDTYKSYNLYWEAWEEEKYIVCIKLRSLHHIQMREVIEAVGHEYGHIINADEVKNSTYPYDTPEGYKQEETKALWFEAFVHDVFNMTKMYLTMFRELGITKRNKPKLKHPL